MTLFLLILLVVLAVASFPAWRPVENRTLYGGYYSSGGLFLLLFVLLLLVLTGHLRV